MRITKFLFNTLKSRPFYVTTPIFYVNAAPHLGHVYTAVVADAIKRVEELMYKDCNAFLGTGTDEHGSKIQKSAENAKLPLQTYCDSISESYASTFKQFNVEYDDFVRTTQERHQKAVHHFWNELKKRDCIYKAKYSGWYSVNDETFVPESQLREEDRNGLKVKVSCESGHIVEWTEEVNYMFRLSAFRSDLKSWLSSESVIVPSKYQRQLLDYISEESYIPDISISRPSSRVHWAIRVPEDPDQCIYVWLDALVNYLTMAGYPHKEAMDKLGRIWPADVQVVGKDILKFHGIYWPAFLMAVGLYPPRQLLCHGHWTVDGQKMSKSLGNVVDPLSTPGGTEALRYFLLREGTMHSDANFSETKLVRIVNSELADTLGNLLGRCTGKAVNPKNIFPALDRQTFNQLMKDDVTRVLVKEVEALPDVCKEFYKSYQFYKVVDAVISALHKCNLFFETQKPWELRKNPETQLQLNSVLHITLECLRISSIILSPIIPKMSGILLDKLQIEHCERYWDSLTNFSWLENNCDRGLSDEKVILFKRILLDDNKVQSAKA